VAIKTLHGINRELYRELPSWAKEAVKGANRKRVKEKVRRGGQASMEFLMTYGWAILVVIAAIGALAYFGVLDSAFFAPESCMVMPGVGCEDYQVLDSGEVSLILRNGIGEDLSNVSVTLNPGPSLTSECAITCTSGCPPKNNKLISNGALTTWSGNECAFIGNDGDRMDLALTFTYQKGSSGILHRKNGTLVTQIVEAPSGGPSL
jgi:hypothetical protein